MLSSEQAGQRLFTGLHHDTFPHPLPKLRLCCPELFPIAADHERCFLLLLLFLHSDTPIPLRVVPHTETPRGNLSCEAASSCQTGKKQKPAPTRTQFLA